MVTARKLRDYQVTEDEIEPAKQVELSVRELTAPELVEDAELLLVLGSSLTVFSGLRFVKRAVERALPVVIVNAGPTRGDPLATLRLEARVGELVPRLVGRLA